MSINIIGAGLAGLSAACTLAKSGVVCNLVSVQPSERSQSVMAEGGINAVLNTMGENDKIENHFNDTVRGGVNLADPNAVLRLCENAPEIVRELDALGVPFSKNENGILQRNFGGQKKKRTAYVKSSTGKMLMTALIDETRKYEAKGLIKRYPRHRLADLNIEDNRCIGAVIADEYSGEVIALKGAVILAVGGMNGLFEERTTGTTVNTGDAAALAFDKGAQLANLEFVQYHPTTIAIQGKRLLISEAARGEGGRLFIKRNGKLWYFMEEKYPELKNLMPRDVVSAEMVNVCEMSGCEPQVYLDMTEISKKVWKTKLSDLRGQCIHYMSIDPAGEPVPVSPGIHYFMGGIYVDEDHRTSINGLYAAGECACQYHGANRLGGNSLLGAIFGGKTAAQTILSDNPEIFDYNFDGKASEADISEVSSSLSLEISGILGNCLKIIRNEAELVSAREQLDRISERALNPAEKRRVNLAKAIVDSAINRRESRGAHKRSDYPETLEKYRKTTIARRTNGGTEIFLRDIPKRRD